MPPAKPNGKAAPAPVQAPLLQFPHEAQAQAPAASTQGEGEGAGSRSGAPAAAPGEFAPRSKMEVFYREVLGETGKLVDKLEKASGRLVRAEKEGEAIRQKIDEAHRSALVGLRRALDEDLGAALKNVQKAAADARSSAQVVQREARRMVLLALCLGGAAGVIGGVLAALALASKFMAR